MNRIDLAYQARWETLKLVIGEAREKASEGSDQREAFNIVLQAMKMLEGAEKPCLSRPIVPYPSPATGEQRAVYDPVPFLKELPSRKELPESKKELPKKS